MPGLPVSASDEWKVVQLFGLPKQRLVREWKDYRWIGCTATLQKSYLRMLVSRLRILAPPPSHELIRVLGFRPGRCCTEIVEAVQTLLHEADQYGSPIYVGVADVETAFDLVSHEVVASALDWSAPPAVHLCLPPGTI